VVCSKTFTTLETLANAHAARQWMIGELGEKALPKHFVAVSTNHPAMDAFGVSPDARFTIWDWVGGRYSLWSAVGLSIALALGFAAFEQMLAGGHDVDEHFRTAPFARNLALSPDKAQRFLYVGGGTDIVVVDRQTLEIVTTIQLPGMVGGGHQIATDSQGNLYIAATTRGLQKLRLTGFK
jgi:glucose-6-phosphate isomerase